MLILIQVCYRGRWKAGEVAEGGGVREAVREEAEAGRRRQRREEEEVRERGWRREAEGKGGGGKGGRW